jgi:osmoprotectant transport system permease protein
MRPATLLVTNDYFQFVFDRWEELLALTIEHVEIIVQAIAIAVPFGILLGTLITYNDTAATVVLWAAGVMMTVPSIALFGLLIPYFGIGKPPVIIALILYSQLPVVRNTYIGLTQVDPASVEAGEGLGMTRLERLRRVKLPMALPVIMAGVRNAIVVLIGIAAIGAFIGAGGLGDYIFNGISDANTAMIVVATVALSLLALTFDYGFAIVEQTLRLRNGEDIDPAYPLRIFQRFKT